jgi:hypothetical protein
MGIGNAINESMGLEPLPLGQTWTIARTNKKVTTLRNQGLASIASPIRTTFGAIKSTTMSPIFS